MQPIHDVDALLLLSLALSSKRRPAELIEIIAAADLLHDPVPSELRLIDAFARLAINGLISAQEGRFALTAEAQKILTGQSKKADTAQRIQSIKDKLAAYEASAEHPPIELTPKEVCSAILAHREAAKSTLKNLLVAKPKPAETASQRPGQRQRKPLPAARRKS